MNLEKEIKRGKSFDLISFDIFDTLVQRDVFIPADIFTLAGEKVLKSEKEAHLFKERRVKAEIEARKESYSGEVVLKDIYRNLFVYYGINAGILKEQELKEEFDHCHPRAQWCLLLKNFHELGKKIVLISDMYLTSAEIKYILDNCGIRNYDGLFVSNEYGCDKVSGRLFLEAVRAMDMEGCRHLHYGDSIRADYLGAKKAGVTPRLVFKINFIKRILKRWMLGC